MPNNKEPLLTAPAAHGAQIVTADARAFIFDVTVAEETRQAYRITSHPAEEGANFSDHIQREPVELTLTGLVSNTPLVPSRAPGDNKKSEAYLRQRERNTGDSVNVYDYIIPGRSRTAYDLLQEIAEERGLVEVVTTNRLFTNMAIASISLPRTPKTSRDALRFTVRLKEIRIVASRYSRVPLTTLRDDVADSGEEEEETSQEGDDLLPDPNPSIIVILEDIVGPDTNFFRWIGEIIF